MQSKWLSKYNFGVFFGVIWQNRRPAVRVVKNNSWTPAKNVSPVTIGRNGYLWKPRHISGIPKQTAGNT
jgi:hypothetical protein